MKEFNRILDTYLITGKIHPEDYEYLDDDHIMIIQTLKRAFKRIKSKYDKDTKRRD